MPKVEVRVPTKLGSFYGESRAVLGQQVKMQALELACERLMGTTRVDMTSNELKSALEAYKELRDTVQGEVDSIDRVQLMLKVVGQNLMGMGEDARTGT